jgi:ATP-dependent DNA helicase RecG
MRYAAVPELQTEIQFLKGIGPRVAETLAGKGIRTVEDLLYYLPFRYEDRINPRSIEELKPGEMASVIAEVRGSGLFRTRRMPIFEMTAGQGRSKLKCLWFRGGYLEGKFKPGALVALYGKVELSTFGRGGLQMLQPEFEILHEPDGDVDPLLPTTGRSGAPTDEQKRFQSLETGRIVPIYEAAGRLNARWFRRIIRSALEQMPDHPSEPNTGSHPTKPTEGSPGAPEVCDPIPAAIRGRMGLVPRSQAFWQVHWPEAETNFAAPPAHLRGAVLPGARLGAETAQGTAGAGHRL